MSRTLEVTVKMSKSHVLYYNARSLLLKLDELRAVCEATKPDFVCIVETWLDDNVSDNDLSLSNYQLFRLHRNRHRGSIAVFVHFSFSCKILLQGGPFALEFISIVSQPSFCLCLFYRPTSSPVSVFDNLCTTLQILSVVNVLVMGLVLGQRLMLISRMRILLYAKVGPLYNVLWEFIVFVYTLTTLFTNI